MDTKGGSGGGEGDGGGMNWETGIDIYTLYVYTLYFIHMDKIDN